MVYVVCEAEEFNLCALPTQQAEQKTVKSQHWRKHYIIVKEVSKHEDYNELILNATY